MAAKRKDSSGRGTSEAQSKLSRLLETESKLDAMLNEARLEAKELVEAAQMVADQRVKQFESQLEGENVELRRRIARDRDRTIDSIQKEAQEETKRLDELDDAQVTKLARYVVDLLIGRPDSRGAR
jgi:vacuolar-type H+-ATPase subunit H